MAYTKTTDFLAKDSLPLNNAAKYVKGSELDAEFDAMEAADALNVKTTALGTGVETFLGTPSSANLAAAVTGETGTGALVFATGPTLVTPILGTPQSGDLQSCTNYPVAAIANLGTGIATFLTTPSSANLASAVTDETGTGALVLANTPTLVTPVLGAATATSINKMAITAPATGSTLAVADGKTLTVSNTMTLTGTDSTSYDMDSLSAATTLRSTVATTSGTSKEFTSIPSTAKKLVLQFGGVQMTAGTSLTLVLGDSGGYETTDYDGTYSFTKAATATDSATSPSLRADFVLTPATGAGADNWTGNIYLEKHDSTGWIVTGVLTDLQGGVSTFAGTKFLSGTLDRVKVVISGATFSGGTLALSYTT